MKNNCFLLICTTRKDLWEWALVTNPSFERKNSAEYFAALMLEIACTPYVEWANCGVHYRVIRASDKKAYLFND